MFNEKEATEERIEAYTAALKHEKDGYQHRIDNLEAGKTDQLTAEQLTARIGEVDDELARVAKSGSKSKAKKAS